MYILVLIISLPGSNGQKHHDPRWRSAGPPLPFGVFPLEKNDTIEEVRCKVSEV